uniref:Putative disease resistance protein RGA2 n=1 Tax=Davidia involucrata TaxID=16924 RepID=A0A5B7C0Z7_DAVIN
MPSRSNYRTGQYKIGCGSSNLQHMRWTTSWTIVQQKPLEWSPKPKFLDFSTRKCCSHLERIQRWNLFLDNKQAKWQKGCGGEDGTWISIKMVRYINSRNLRSENQSFTTIFSLFFSFPFSRANTFMTLVYL